VIFLYRFASANGGLERKGQQDVYDVSDFEV
jgi:hypothetical protein